MADVVIDASALVDLLLGGAFGEAVALRIAHHGLHAPAHLDGEALSALGRLHRAGFVDAGDVEVMLSRLVVAPIVRHSLDALVMGAWGRRDNLRLADALSVELAQSLAIRLVTTDRRLMPVDCVDVVTEDRPG
jgi:predicted nucleic acid-binding protein